MYNICLCNPSLLSVVIAHLGINTIYSASVETMPNLTFFICAAIAGCSCLSAFLVQEASESEEIESLNQDLTQTHKPSLSLN